ncbi:MAG TPA: SDR family oxidoreductase [Acidimicrobiales bacterium]|jgi:NAD(P)-dependent dehydrogenase (short-subunit alcohol dehydrogenase family)|nr:SDR family oxidoreductase [Acidimicrobiales bacterium]
MELGGQVAVVTGGAGGIGAALCRRFADEGAAGVVVADLDGDGAAQIAAEVTARGARGLAVTTDLRRDEDIRAMVHRAQAELGPIDLLCSNAGVAIGGGVEAPDEAWEQSWEVNLLAHVRAVRAVLPGMLERGRGYLLHTASAAGLLTNLGAAPYAVTKHGVVALAEWLSITYADAGIRVSCLCPQGVRTPMLLGPEAAGPRGPQEDRDRSGPVREEPGGPTGQGSLDDGIGTRAVLTAGRVLEPEAVADSVVAGLAAEQFLILPHEEVADYVRHRAEDRERWLTGMRRLQARLTADAGP